ncbi:MAG: hypothetical protein WC236_09830 [Gallionellaceae bacterium]|jgi:hypothetical protein
MMISIKRTVRVVIEKEIEIELTPSVFGKMTQDDYLSEFRRSLWDVDGIDDVVTYAARMAATDGNGYQHDGIGMVGYFESTYPRVPDVKFRTISENYEEEIVGGDTC